MELTEKVVSSKKAYNGNIFDIRVDEVILPDGKKGIREVLEHKGAVVILPVTKEGEFVLVKQYRHPINDVLIELPAGKLEEGEEITEAAYRELSEETGYIAENMIPYGEIIPAAGYSAEKLYVFLSTDLEEIDTQSLDEDEFIDIVKIKPDKIKRMIFNNEIEDMKTISVVLKYLMENNL